MNRTSLLYFLREGFSGIWKNRLMSVVSIGILAACLIILGGFFLVFFNVNAFMDELAAQNEIVAFLDEALTEEQISGISTELGSINNIATIAFISKEQALEEYKAEFANDSNALEGLDEFNPMRNSYHVTLKDLSQFDTTLYQIEQISGIANIRNHQDIAEKLVSLRNILYFISTALLIVLLVISVFIISNTIRLAMYVRKREINIMKYVGATDTFIRAPFLVEGILIGVISGLIAYLAIWYIYVRVITPAITTAIGGFALLPFEPLSFSMMLYMLIGGIVVGALGSLISIRRHLKV
jgi:cell division transport system permease protein